MMRRDPRAFGRSRPYIAPAVRRRKARNRLAALVLGSGGMAALLSAYALTGAADHAASQGPNVAGFFAFMLVLGGFLALALGILAAMES